MRTGSVAVFTVFVLNGLVFASWAPRVPAIADQVGATVGALGLALLCSSLGLILTASVAGRICVAVGARVLVLVGVLVACAALPVLGLVAAPWMLGAALFVLGAANGAIDVGMNVAAVTVVRAVERPLMPVFHAGFSFGALAGSAGAALAAAADWSLLRHFVVVGAVAAVVIVVIRRGVPVEQARTPSSSESTAVSGNRPPARRPVLWLLGCVALCSAIAEGASAEWSAFFGVHQRGLDEAAAAAILAGFSVAMALTRLAGERVERRWGPDRVLVVASMIAGTGLLVVVCVPHALATYVGFALAGVGLAYAFPITLNLAGSVGRRADGGGGEREIGFVTTIAYTGFLGGPPLIGGIAQVTSIGVALGVVGVAALAIGPLTMAAAAARRRDPPPVRREEGDSVPSW